MLYKLEAFTFFFAVMLAIILEGAVVYRASGHPLVRATSYTPFNVVGEWNGLTLPQAWLLSALLVLFYRVVAMFTALTNRTDSEFQSNRGAFVCLWRWTIALIAMQGLVLFLGRPAAS